MLHPRPVPEGTSLQAPGESIFVEHETDRLTLSISFFLSYQLLANIHLKQLQALIIPIPILQSFANLKSHEPVKGLLQKRFETWEL